MPEHPEKRELRQAAKAMEHAANMLTAPAPDEQKESAALFDEAAARVCRSCAKYPFCWQEKEGALSEALSRSVRTAPEQGAVLPEDLPVRFREQCIHLDAFLTAVNDAMDDRRARRRRARRLQELCGAAQSQYILMSSLLTRLSERLYAPDTPVNFRPELSVRAASRGGSAISGDRGAAFAGPDATY